MAKSKKSKNEHRLRNVVSAAVILVPALFAAVTAFMNTAFARDNGLTPDALTDGPSKSKARRRTKKSAA